MNDKTGGPAFPSGLIDPSTPEDAVQSLHNGMTLRDYFAAKALAHTYTHHDSNADKAAEWAYVMADAMMKARKV